VFDQDFLHSILDHLDIWQISTSVLFGTCDDLISEGMNSREIFPSDGFDSFLYGMLDFVSVESDNSAIALADLIECHKNRK
jgi:hypothetical protein